MAMPEAAKKRRVLIGVIIAAGVAVIGAPIVAIWLFLSATSHATDEADKAAAAQHSTQTP
jgi:flagellar basal body-associated protein FliL